jgi:hypothetical protein
MKRFSLNSALGLAMATPCLVAIAGLAPRPALAIAAPDARAVCSAAGALDAGRSENVVQCQRLAAGRYRLLIGNSVTHCTFVATIGLNVVGIPPAGEIGVAPRAAANEVLVQTRNSAGNPADRPFHLFVAC